MERSLSEDLGEGGAAAVVVDRVGDAEDHRFGEAQGQVPELDVSLEQVLAALLHECHRVHVSMSRIYTLLAG